MKLSHLLMAATLAFGTTFPMTAHEKSGVLTLELSDGVKLEMVKVEAGTLTISAAHREKQVCPHCGQPIKASTVNAANGKKQDNGKQHTATLTKAFYIGKTEVTQAQWKAVMGNNPSNFQSDVLPVEGVSWNDAMTFCEKLNAMGKAPKGWKFTLPTEAQWEYAARGGSKSNGHKYSGVKDKDVGKAAWYKANSGDQTHQVGKKRANELGLHDMSGNVWEWCLDEIVISGPKSESAQGNDQVRLARARRGGGWGSVAEYCRIAERDSKDPGYRFYDLGFRLALVPVQ